MARVTQAGSGLTCESECNWGHIGVNTTGALVSLGAGYGFIKLLEHVHDEKRQRVLTQLTLKRHALKRSQRLTGEKTLQVPLHGTTDLPQQGAHMVHPLITVTYASLLTPLDTAIKAETATPLIDAGDVAAGIVVGALLGGMSLLAARISQNVMACYLETGDALHRRVFGKGQSVVTRRPS